MTWNLQALVFLENTIGPANGHVLVSQERDLHISKTSLLEAPLTPGKVGKVRVSGAGNDSTVVGLELSSSVSECNVLAIGSQDERGAKIIGLSHVRLDEGALDDTLLEVHALDVTVSEPGSGVSHGKGGAYSFILGLDILCSSILKKKINLVNIRS